MGPTMGRSYPSHQPATEVETARNGLQFRITTPVTDVTTSRLGDDA
ncbi:hypothetical protein SAMN02787149_11940 [Pseudomonas sp. Snoq117.2]|nr:hypothetical protein SAMN02787149_1023 [Pseudomonas sp. Snoq117.2]SEP38152.1 hypothetical protein SAMN02787149_1083 [Pseudomonas sp. Snoq117.2]SEP44117.1 hypothetical protein SAMN02787149_11497 [Pseudomonas sp. Snoq117.2]SEP46180.1 hypothetical protein SAMN02787149_11940 [Pseudomonas sp. Snoq117.2]